MNAKVITVVATFQARSGRETELKETLIGLVAPTRKEAGCLNYERRPKTRRNFSSTKIGQARPRSTRI
jgi:quinol monooxygenase YgiN